MCEQVGFAPVCGTHGTCVNNSICICDAGWSQSLEFAFFIENRDTVDQRTLVCDGNEQLLTILYALVATMGFLGPACYLIFVKRLSQFKRLIPYFMANAIFVALALLRLTDNSRIFGQDVAFSVLASLCLFLILVTFEVFLQKYVAFQYKMLPVKSVSARRLVNFTNRVLQFCLAISTLSLIFTGGAVFAGNLALTIVRLGFGFSAIGSLTLLTVGLYLMQRFIDDVRGVRVATSSKGTSKDKVGQIVKNLVRIRKAVAAEAIVMLVACALPVFSNLCLSAWKYLFPVFLSFADAMTLVVLYSNRRERIRNKLRSGLNTAMNVASGKGGKSAKGDKSDQNMLETSTTQHQTSNHENTHEASDMDTVDVEENLRNTLAKRLNEHPQQKLSI